LWISLAQIAFFHFGPIITSFVVHPQEEVFMPKKDKDAATCE